MVIKDFDEIHGFPWYSIQRSSWVHHPRLLDIWSRPGNETVQRVSEKFEGHFYILSGFGWSRPPGETASKRWNHQHPWKPKVLGEVYGFDGTLCNDHHGSTVPNNVTEFFANWRKHLRKAHILLLNFWNCLCFKTLYRAVDVVQPYSTTTAGDRVHPLPHGRLKTLSLTYRRL